MIPGWVIPRRISPNGLRGRRTIAVTAVLTLPLAAATSALATTAVTVKNPGGLASVGPVNAENGFPAWYQDSSPAKTRVELCLDGDNPLCGFLPGDIPNPDAPISFPDNFPEEAFYFLASSTMNLPGGGRATLTLGVEAAFANTVTNGDQITFARQRIVVVGGPRNTTMHFDHPYGSIDIDTDSSGKGRLVEDVSPATGNFTTALKGNIGPFLSWGAGAPAGYVGDPAIEHTVVGGPLRNTFDATWTGGAATQNLFTVQGKIATNSGVTVDAAVANGNFLDVFASSEADPGELYVAAGGDVPSTPMQADAPAPGATTPRSFYARIDMTGKSMPTKITVRNIGDTPASSGEVDVTRPSGITVTDASYDGTTLHVRATSTGTAPLTVSGYGTALTDGVADIATTAPPRTVSVTDGADKATAQVRITDGAVTPAGLPPVAVTPDPGPICDPAPCGAGGPAPDATPTAIIAPVTASLARGDTLALDGSGSTNSTGWKWTQVGGTPVTITGDTAAKPTIKPAFVDPKAASTQPANDPAVIQLVSSNGTTSSAPVTVSVPIKLDTVTVGSGRYKAGTEIRIDGTSTVPGGSLILTPPTTVAVYTAAGQLVGTAQVDTTGAWSVRVRTAAEVNAIPPFTSVRVVSSRGGFATFNGVTTK
ncbi:MAG: hypothetical protein JF630_04955 [Geodermatophilales bacterium]|nr:hypothetical protein [Geodermatophilales bacterium]